MSLNFQLHFSTYPPVDTGLPTVALVLKKGDYELYMTIAALPVTLAVLAAAVQAAKREIRWLMGVVMAFVMLGFAYFAFKVGV